MEAKFESEDGSCYIALHTEVINGHKDIVIHILRSTLNIDIVDDQGRTALHMALQSGDSFIFEILISAGSDLKATVVKGDNILVHAASGANLSILEGVFSSKSAALDIPVTLGDATRWPPSHWPARIDNLQLMQLLRNAGMKYIEVNTLEQSINTWRAVDIVFHYHNEKLISAPQDFDPINGFENTLRLALKEPTYGRTVCWGDLVKESYVSLRTKAHQSGS